MFAVLRAARKSLTKVALGLSVIALAACDPGALPVTGGPKINTSNPVPVALLVPYESQQGGDVGMARSIENAARLAMADLDGVSIDLRVYPTGGQAERASAAATQAVKRNYERCAGSCNRNTDQTPASSAILWCSTDRAPICQMPRSCSQPF